jgi:hypothetical protein
MTAKPMLAILDRDPLPMAAILATYATHPVKVVGIVNEVLAAVLRLDLKTETIIVVPISELVGIRITKA